MANLALFDSLCSIKKLASDLGASYEVNFKAMKGTAIKLQRHATSNMLLIHTMQLLEAKQLGSLSSQWFRNAS